MPIRSRAPARARAEQQLAAEPVRRLEQHDVVAALGATRAPPRGRPARRRPPRPCGPAGRRVRSRAAGSFRGRSTGLCRQCGRYCDWQCVAPTQGRIRSSCPASILRDDMRVGDVRARHRHHVEQALGDGVARGRDVGDAGGVEHRQLHLAPEGADAAPATARSATPCPACCRRRAPRSVSMRP